MPLPPFHFGPGIAFKAIGGRHFSFMVFGGSQFLMDLETGIRMVYGAEQLHAFTTTFVGALLVGAVSGLIGKPITNAVFKWVAPGTERVTWRASFIAAYAGTLSHVLLDSIMHSDAQPWSPFSLDNPLLGILSMRWLHLACIFAGIGGAIALCFKDPKKAQS